MSAIQMESEWPIALKEKIKSNLELLFNQKVY